ncbi:MAG TPA: DUF6323 family protein [Oscillospiraceae bacterium]|nr:DUF6323 family protein [Oscillospiraceae bacterium]
MEHEFAPGTLAVQMRSAAQELRALEEVTAPYGLSLSEEQIRNLVERRFDALRETGRVEFGGGVLGKLVRAFCDSPYLTRENYEETLLELQDSFYYFKNESMDRLTDDELIEFMKRVFSGRAQGSLDYLAGTSLEELCRYAREGFDPRDAGRLGDRF